MLRYNYRTMFPKIAGFLVMSALTVLAQDASKLRAEFLSNFDDAAKKIVSLAEAVPADKYSWRPAEGVRSIGEVYMHITGADVMIPSMVGAKPPADLKLGKDFEKTINQKDQIVPMLKRAVEHARQAISTAMETPDKPTKLFGKDSTNAGVALLIITHMHEHLGQSIAYARSVKVTPPWSAGGQ